MAQARQVRQTSKRGDAGKDGVGLGATITRECIVPQRLVRSRHGLLIMSCMGCNSSSPAQSEKGSRKHCVCECTDSRRRETRVIYALPITSSSSNLRTKYHTPNTTPNTTYNATPTHHHGLQARKYPKRASMPQPPKVQTHRHARSASPTLWLTCRNELAGSGNRSMGWLRSSCRCLVSGTDNVVGFLRGWLTAVDKRERFLSCSVQLSGIEYFFTGYDCADCHLSSRHLWSLKTPRLHERFNSK